MYIHVYVTGKTQLMSYVQPFWRVDQASSGFWQASRSLLSFFWSPLHFLRITICQILVKNWKNDISGCLSLNHLGQNWKEVSFKTRKTSANFGWTSMVSSDWSSYQTPLPVKIRCWIDLSQRQAKAQVQMPFHSKPPISCALDLTFFEVVTKPWWFFSQQKGHVWKGIFGCLVSSTWGEKKNLQKKQKDAPTSGIQLSEVVFHLILWTLRTFHWSWWFLCLFICWACWPPNVKMQLLPLKSQAGTPPKIRYWIGMIHHDSSWIIASMTLLPPGSSSKSPAPRTPIRLLLRFTLLKLTWPLKIGIPR